MYVATISYRKKATVIEDGFEHISLGSVYRKTEPISDMFKHRYQYRRRSVFTILKNTEYRNKIPKIPKVGSVFASTMSTGILTHKYAVND